MIVDWELSIDDALIPIDYFIDLVLLRLPNMKSASLFSRLFDSFALFRLRLARSVPYFLFHRLIALQLFLEIT